MRGALESHHCNRCDFPQLRPWPVPLSSCHLVAMQGTHRARGTCVPDQAGTATAQISRVCLSRDKGPPFGDGAKRQTKGNQAALGSKMCGHAPSTTSPMLKHPFAPAHSALVAGSEKLGPPGIRVAQLTRVRLKTWSCVLFLLVLAWVAVCHLFTFAKPEEISPLRMSPRASLPEAARCPGVASCNGFPVSFPVQNGPSLRMDVMSLFPLHAQRLYKNHQKRDQTC